MNWAWVETPSHASPENNTATSSVATKIARSPNCKGGGLFDLRSICFTFATA